MGLSRMAMGLDNQSVRSEAGEKVRKTISNCIAYFDNPVGAWHVTSRVENVPHFKTQPAGANKLLIQGTSVLAHH